MNTKDKETIRNYIVDRVSSYSSEENIGFIQFGYEPFQGGLLCVYFDTKKDAGPDGTWTIRLDGNSIDMNHWPELSENGGDEFSEQIGESIKQIVFELKEEGVFQALPKTEDCDFGIEEMNGSFGWPEYEKRKKINLV